MSSNHGSPVNTLGPRQNGRHLADDIFKCIFLNGNVWISIKISLKFVPKGPINNIPSLVQIMAWRRPGDKPLSEAMMVNLPTHICVTRPQWVKNIISCLTQIRVAPTKYITGIYKCICWCSTTPLNSEPHIFYKQIKSCVQYIQTHCFILKNMIICILKARLVMIRHICETTCFIFELDNKLSLLNHRVIKCLSAIKLY